MIFLLSGEGKTDLGQNHLGEIGTEFIPSPMVYFIDGLYHKQYGYSLLETDTGQLLYISESELGQFAKRKKNPRRFHQPGYKHQRIELHASMARALGWKAFEISRDKDQDVVIPVLFRDSDKGSYQEKLESMDLGFAAAGFPNRGVAMLPNPKSEAWLLCLADNYQNGKQYEEGPKTDNSPNSLKLQLCRKIAPDLEINQLSREQLCEFMRSRGSIDFERLSNELTSFAEFVIRFKRAMNAKQN